MKGAEKLVKEQTLKNKELKKNTANSSLQTKSLVWNKKTEWGM